MAVGSPKDDRHRGMYRKFDIRRTDGSSEPGSKHEGCDYFVLDLTHDPHAIDALEAYGKSCQTTYPKLSEEIRHIVVTKRCSTLQDSLIDP